MERKSFFEKFKGEKSTDKTIAVFTGVLVVVNIVFIGFSINQSIDTSKSIALADSSLCLAQKNFDIENRAFITFEWITNVKYKIGKGLHYSIYFKNIGHSPASIQYAWITSCISDSTFFGNTMRTLYVPKKLDSIVMKNPRYTIIGTNMEFILNEDFPVTTASDQKYIDALSSGQTKWYVLGNIIYNDFFGKQHFTHFCGICDWNTNEFAPVGKYNDIN